MKAALARLSEPGWGADAAKAITMIPTCPFLLGLGDGREWRASFLWFTRPDSVSKIVEGNYTAKPSPNGTNGHAAVEAPRFKTTGSFLATDIDGRLLRRIESEEDWAEFQRETAEKKSAFDAENTRQKAALEAAGITVL